MSEPQPPYQTRYQLAWIQLYDLLAILDRAGCPPLALPDLLNIMRHLITAQVIKPDP